ncbi:MAG: ATP-binding protein [bacterium]|nr:ATP-binding protein [bacterium]
MESNYQISLIAGTLLFALLTVFIIFFILLYRRTRVKLHWERERIKQELLRVENEVKEQTLINVSRELHDNFGQVAALIKINLNLISKTLKGDELEQAKESLVLIQQLLTDIKSLSASLNGERLKEIGWIQAVADDIKRVNAIGELKIEFEAAGRSKLSTEKQVVFYRITQEILSNMLKHAKAYTAQIKVNCNDHVILYYSDNGVGFDENKIVPGQGLDNIRQRCELIGASVEISGKPAQGTQITLKIKNDGS